MELRALLLIVAFLTLLPFQRSAIRLGQDNVLRCDEHSTKHS